MKTMPQPLDYGTASAGQIGRLIAQKDDFDPKYDNPTGGRTVMGFALPTWQRPLVWTEPQKVKFIESAWLGLGLGTYTVNNLIGKGLLTHPLNNLLIDGQQRISTIEAYLNDEFAVFGAKWSEVSRDDKRRFKNAKFAVYETASTDEAYLRGYYDLMNFGGTPHTPEQFASFDAGTFADRVLSEQGNLVRERFEDGTVVYYDFRMADPEVNDPGPEIAVIPGTLDGEMFVRLDRAVRREAVFAAMRAEPSLAVLAPPPADLALAWISDEDGKDVAIVLGRGDDGRTYIVERDKRSVKRIEEDGLIRGEFDLHDRPFSEISKEKCFGVDVTP